MLLLPRLSIPLLALLLTLPQRAHAGFSFNFTNPTNQCSNLTITWSAGGTPPYNLLFIPIGSLDNEIRTIVDLNFTSSSDPNSNVFTTPQLAFPSKSQFIAVMSDANGVGTGGTSLPITVGDGPTNCLSTTTTKPKFYFYMSPLTVSQCEPVKFTWDDSKSSGGTTMWGIIPGGQSFAIPLNNGDPSSGVTWTTDIRTSTQLLFVAGDSSGHGKGGSSDLMSVGSSGSSGCINSSSPSSTPGVAAGQVQTAGPNPSSGSGSGGGGGSAAPTGTGAGTGSPTGGTSPTGTNGSPASGGSPTPTGNNGGNGNGNGNGNSNGNGNGNGGTAPGSNGGTVSGQPIATGSGGSGQNQPTHHNSLAALIGGILGGVLVLLILALVLLFCLLRRRRRAQGAYTQHQNLLAEEPVRSRPGTWYASQDVPSSYRPEPFVFPAPGSSGQASHGHSNPRRSLSTIYSSSGEDGVVGVGGPVSFSRSHSHSHSSSGEHGYLGRRDSYTSSSGHGQGHHRHTSSMSDYGYMMPTTVTYTPEPFSDRFASARPLSPTSGGFAPSAWPLAFTNSSGSGNSNLVVSNPSSRTRSGSGLLDSTGPSGSNLDEKSASALPTPPQVAVRQPLIRGMSHMSTLSQDEPDGDAGDPERVVDLPPQYHSIRRKSRYADSAEQQSDQRDS